MQDSVPDSQIETSGEKNLSFDIRVLASSNEELMQLSAAVEAAADSLKLSFDSAEGRQSDEEDFIPGLECLTWLLGSAVSVSLGVLSNAVYAALTARQKSPTLRQTVRRIEMINETTGARILIEERESEEHDGN